MPASINDKIIQAENGGNPQPTTVSSPRSIGGTSLSCVALTNWPTATAVHLITYKKKTDGTMDRTTLCLWKGIVSGTTIGTLTLKGGTDAGNVVGDFVEAAPTSAQWQDLYDGLSQTLNVDGTLKDSVVTTSKIANAAVKASNIDFTTFAGGGQLFVQSVVVYNATTPTLGTAGSIYFYDAAAGGNWPVAFSNLLGVVAVCDNIQFWVTMSGATNTTYGNTRLYKFSNGPQQTKITVIGFGIK